MTGVDVGVTGVTGGMIAGILTAYTIDGRISNIKSSDGQRIMPGLTGRMPRHKPPKIIPEPIS